MKKSKSSKANQKIKSKTSDAVAAASAGVIAQIEDIDARMKILTVSTRLFAEHGLHGISVREIAKASGLNLSLISYYFGGKEGLYKAVMENYANQVLNNLSHMFEIHADKLDKKIFIENMREFIRKFILLRKKSPDIAIILYRERLSGLPFARDVYENTFSRIGTSIVELLRVAQKKKIVKAEICPHDFILFLSEAILGYVNAHECKTNFMKHCINLEKDEEKLIDQLMMVFLQGVLI